jgi:hypothetical protein
MADATPSHNKENNEVKNHGGRIVVCQPGTTDVTSPGCRYGKIPIVNRIKNTNENFTINEIVAGGYFSES